MQRADADLLATATALNQRLSTAECQNVVTADGRTLHAVKGIVSGALAMNERVLSHLAQFAQSIELNQTPRPLAGDGARLAELQALAVDQKRMLLEAFEQCTSRSAFLELECGSYTLTRVTMPVQAMLGDMIPPSSSPYVVVCAGGEAGKNTLVSVDPVMLKLLLLELFANAVKYREPDSLIVVRVAVWPVGESKEARHDYNVEGTLEITIESQDKLTAPSLTPEECARVFEHGFRGNNAQSTGSGVGLSTAAKAAAALGGTLSMAVGQSPDGNDLTAVTLRATMMKPDSRADAACAPLTSTPSEGFAPYRAPAPEFATATAADAAVEEESAKVGQTALCAKLRFLIADDSRMQLKLLAIILKQMCPLCKISSVLSGEDALAKLAPKGSRFNPLRYDVLITDNDYGNGLLTGVELVALVTQLRGGSAQQRSCGLITVGCSASASSLEAMHHAGADLLWRKPIPDSDFIARQLARAIACVREES